MDNISPLRQSALDLAWKWVDEPFGVQFDNGYCDSEMSSSTLMRILKEHDDATLHEGLARFVIERERYEPGNREAGQVRTALFNAGHEPPARPAPMTTTDPAPSKPAWKRLFGR